MSRTAATNRTAIANNGYQVLPSTSLDTCDVITGWAVNASGTIAISTDYYKSGVGALKITVPNNSATCDVTKTIAWDMGNSDVLEYDMYISDIAKLNNINFYLSSTSAMTHYFFQVHSATNGLVTGWNRIRLLKANFVNTTAESWFKKMIKLQITVKTKSTGGGLIVYIDNIRTGGYNRPKVVWTCDDGFTSAYTEWYDYMHSKGLNGTIYAVGKLISDTDPNFCSLDDLKEMYEGGFDICNQTYNHRHLDDLTDDEVYSEIASMQSYLINNGFTRNGAQYHMSYPYDDYHNNVQTIASDLGIVTGQGAAQQQFYTSDIVRVADLEPMAHWISILGKDITTLAAAKTYIDDAIKYGQNVFFASHKYVEADPADGTEWLISDMEALVDYIYDRRHLIDCCTISEWWNGYVG